MRRILICTGVLGGGSALVFAAAALTAILIPPTRIVPQSQNIVLDTVGGPVNAGGGVMTVTGTAPGPVVVAIPAPEPTP